MLGDGGYAKIFSAFEKNVCVDCGLCQNILWTWKKVVGWGGWAKIFYGLIKCGGGGRVVMQKYFIDGKKCCGRGAKYFMCLIKCWEGGGGV